MLLSQPHGRVMKEYVAVPESMWKESTALRRAFVSSVAYVGSLKPKVSKRKKAVVRKPVENAGAVKQQPVAVTSVTSRTAVARKAAKKTVTSPVAKKITTKTAARGSKTNGAAKTSAKKSTVRKTTSRKASPKKAAAKKTTVRRKAVARS